MIHIVSFWIVRYVALNFSSATCHFLFLIVVNMRQRQIQINARLHERDIVMHCNSRLYCVYKTKYFKYWVGMTFCYFVTIVLIFCCISGNFERQIVTDRWAYILYWFFVLQSIIFRSYQNAVRTIFTGLLIFIVGRQRIKSVSTMQIKSNHQDVKQQYGIAVSDKNHLSLTFGRYVYL